MAKLGVLGLLFSVHSVAYSVLLNGDRARWKYFVETAPFPARNTGMLAMMVTRTTMMMMSLCMHVVNKYSSVNSQPIESHFLSRSG